GFLHCRNHVFLLVGGRSSRSYVSDRRLVRRERNFFASEARATVLVAVTRSHFIFSPWVSLGNACSTGTNLNVRAVAVMADKAALHFFGVALHVKHAVGPHAVDEYVERVVSGSIFL